MSEGWAYSRGAENGGVLKAGGWVAVHAQPQGGLGSVARPVPSLGPGYMGWYERRPRSIHPVCALTLTLRRRVFGFKMKEGCIHVVT